MIPSPAIYTASASVTTSSTCAATLTNDGATFWFCSGFEITYSGATLAGSTKATLTGLLGGTLTFFLPVPAGATVGANPLLVNFGVALAAASANSDVVLTIPPTGAGSTSCNVNLHGYKGARQLNA